MAQTQIGRAATRKAFEPSPEQREAVIAMASVGLAHEKIARCVFNPDTGKPISRTTLYRQYRDELDKGAYDPVCNAILNLIKEIKKGISFAITCDPCPHLLKSRNVVPRQVRIR